MIYPIRNIVAGIAVVEESDPLLAAALTLAARTGAMLHLVHAFDPPNLIWDACARTGMMQATALDDHAQALRTRLEAQVRSASTGERVGVEVVAGAPAPAILAAAARETADLIIVGAARNRPLARPQLGTTAQRVLRESRAPVLVPRGPLPAHLDRVLLTTDLSPFSAGIHEAGLDVLESLFSGDEPELRSLHVVWQGGELPFPVEHTLLDESARAATSEFLRERRSRARPVAGVVRYGDPSREILAEAEEWRADVLVLGTHGRPAPVRWFLGSVAESSIGGGTGTALVIPARTEEERTLPVGPVTRSGRAVTPPLA